MLDREVVGGIVVLGSLNMDLVAVATHLPASGETLIAQRYFANCGGKGANQAFAAARLGGAVTMLGRVGTDQYGETMRANLAAAGCDIGGIHAAPGPSGIALITVSEAGENTIVVVPGANQEFAADDLAREATRFANARYLLLQLESPLPTVAAALRIARAHGCKVILDPAPAPGALSTELLAGIDILTPNELEAARLTGLPAVDLSIDHVAQIADKLRVLGVGAVIVTLGGRGSLVVDDDGTDLIPPCTVQAVDTTAAGDTFNAALAVALGEGASLREACRFGARAAAICVQRFGAQAAMPTRDEVGSIR